jgi:hypothetical protein
MTETKVICAVENNYSLNQSTHVLLGQNWMKNVLQCFAVVKMSLFCIRQQVFFNFARLPPSEKHLVFDCFTSYLLLPNSH